MAVRQSRSPLAASGEDPEQIVNEFWVAFGDLLGRYNQQLAATGESPLRWRELAEAVNISDRTFSDWRNKRIVPSNPAPLVKAAVFLGGRQEDWQIRWRKA